MPGRIRILPGALVALTLLLAGCAALPGGGPDDQRPTREEFEQRLAELPGVLSVDVAGEDHASVEIALAAADDTVLSTAAAAASLAEELDWPGEVAFTRERGGLDPVTDIHPLRPWRHLVYPGDPAEVAAMLGELLVIEKMQDVVSVALRDGWPSVVLASLDTFAASFRELSALPRFAGGATYTYAGELPRLHVVHIAERMSPEAIEAVIRIAAENPEAEVELQSLTSVGNRWPELWVAHLTPEQVAVVDAQLRDPGLADADLEGYSIPFQLSTIGPGGPVLTHGTFGDVPDSSS